MKRFTSRIWLVAVLSTGLLMTACASYYKVTDPSTGKIYYTDKVKREGSGAAMFKDARSGAEVTIQNSEVKEISEKDFDAGSTAPTSKPAPAPFAAPTPAPAPAPSQSTAPAQGSK